jgi:hypothetical protein
MITQLKVKCVAEEMRWEIAQLVDSMYPDGIIGKLEEMVKSANELAEKYRGKIKNLDAPGLHVFLEARDDFSLK